MNPDTLNTTYENISNPILRLMLYSLAAAVVGLCSVVVYMYRENISLQREMIRANYDNIKALDGVADALTDLAASNTHNP
jgi:hypothetical protein